MEIKEKEIKEMTERHYVQIPVTDYNRLPMFETNVMDSLEDIRMMESAISGLRSYAEYLEKITKERETEILDNMAYAQECREASTHFENYMNVPFPEVESGTRYEK